MQAVAVDFGFCFVFKRHIKLLLLLLLVQLTCKIVWVDFEHIKYTSNGCVD